MMLRMIILVFTCMYLAYLLWEHRAVGRWRRGIPHIIYVNGTRGKSTVTRLIDGGLRAGGLRVFCKTTGTLPMTIGVDGVERPIRRWGSANILEQIHILRQAYQQKAQVLVIECMALDPYLQWYSQHAMLQADIGVITNVRPDHAAEMGSTLPQVCQALCGTIPAHGQVFTGDAAFFPQIQAYAAAQGSRAVLTEGAGLEHMSLFPENQGLALAVCQALGVSREAACQGMADFVPDPFALSVHRFPQGAVFINALSVNDPVSTKLALTRVVERYGFGGRRLILLLNNRQDRGYRTRDMVALARDLSPGEIWLCGGSRSFARRALQDLSIPIRSLDKPSDAPFADLGPEDLVLAAGNIAGPGMEIMERVRKEAALYV